MTLVTGGASGLGQATVKRFVRNGAKVIICDQQTIAGEQIAQQFNNDQVIFLSANVSNENDVTNLLNEIKKKFGQLNAVINCAGLSATFATYNFNRRLPRDLMSFEVPVKVC